MKILLYIFIIYVAIMWGFATAMQVLLFAAAHWPLILLSMIVVSAMAGGYAHARGLRASDAAIQGFFWPVVAVFKIAVWLGRAVFGITKSARVD
jgi:hypothetical protein